MSLVEKINASIKEAMLAKQEGRLRGLRAIKSAILIAQSEKGAAENLTTEKEIQVLTKLAKQRKESIEIFEKENRTDLSVKEKEELEVIESYMPKQMTADEVIDFLKPIIEQVGAKSAADMGKVMGVASKQLAGKADGKMVSELVKQLLAN
ncbi:MAG: hypothetical protein RJA07_1042 [Bacteroidota bacterium]|jgi:uncharacterized protein YqeY